jgi:glucan phosphoethanolaminetransferase (alkaline phosphatase superfamily)
MIEYSFIVLFFLSSLLFFLRIRRNRKLSKLDYPLLIVLIISSSFVVSNLVINFSTSAKLKSKIEEISKAQEEANSNLNLSDLKRYELFVEKLNEINLDGTSEEFEEAFNEYRKYFNLSLNRCKELNSIDTLYTADISKAKEKLLAVVKGN